MAIWNENNKRKKISKNTTELLVIAPHLSKLDQVNCALTKKKKKVGGANPHTSIIELRCLG